MSASNFSARRTRAVATVMLGGLLSISSVWPVATAAADPSLLGPPPTAPRDGSTAPVGSAAPAEPTGRFFVTYRPGASPDQRRAIRAQERLELIEVAPVPDTELVEAAAGMTTQAVTALSRRAEIALVEPEYRRTILAGPTGEPLFGQQWALNNTGQTVGLFAGARDVDMNVPEAWQITTGDPNLVVAVIDDGVDLTHPDLVDRAWVNPGETSGDGIDNDGNGLVDDVNGWDFCHDDNTVHDPGEDFHGTHVAGSIAASGNGTGIVGVAPSIRIMAIKFLGDPACGTDMQAAKAIAYARSMGARIINASWGGYGNSATIRSAIAAASNVLVVAAAGNDGTDNDGPDRVYPASYDLPNILSVAAVHNEGSLSIFSNVGRTSVDIAAPGEDIMSSLPNAQWGLLSGTSMAAANASGVAVLAASARPSLLGNPSALRAHLIGTARALPNVLGAIASPRLLDARAAVVSRPDLRRLSGADRYSTAAAISSATFAPRVPYLFVATGAGFPDALAGSALAAQVGSPLLLVSQTSIPSATLAEIQRLKPYDIYVLGGTGVVSESVKNRLASLDNPSSGGPYRLAGADRFATAAAISNAGFARNVNTAFISTGANFPDALAGAPASSVFGGPLLLVSKSAIPAATATELSRLKPQRIFILGGTSVVSAGVATMLDDYTDGPVSRMSGADRYATAVAVATQAFPASETAFVANGVGFADALAGGPSAGAFGGPLLLVSPTGAPASTAQQLQRLQPARVFVLGGQAAVSNSVVSQIEALFP